MNLNLDFTGARSKHMFFRTKVRGYLLGSDSNESSFKNYLREAGDWINSLAVKYNLTFEELIEANYLYNELAEFVNRLISLRRSGRKEEAGEVFNKIEATGDKLLATLNELEKRIKES